MRQVYRVPLKADYRYRFSREHAGILDQLFEITSRSPTRFGASLIDARRAH
jgi:hypothetical protein